MADFCAQQIYSRWLSGKFIMNVNTSGMVWSIFVKKLDPWRIIDSWLLLAVYCHWTPVNPVAGIQFTGTQNGTPNLYERSIILINIVLKQCCRGWWGDLLCVFPTSCTWAFAPDTEKWRLNSTHHCRVPIGRKPHKKNYPSLTYPHMYSKTLLIFSMNCRIVLTPNLTNH